MSLLNYFKPATKDTEEIVRSLNETNNITQVERDEITKQIAEDKSKKRKKYRVWKPEERAEIGKHAVTRGNKSALLCLKTKYPELTRQTISDFAKAYRELKSKSNYYYYYYYSNCFTSLIVKLTTKYHIKHTY